MSGTRAPVRLRSPRRVVFVPLCAVAVAALSACGSSGSSAGAASVSATAATGSGSSSASGSGTTASPPAVIAIKDFGFTTPHSVSPGATVTVNNMDAVAHTVTADIGGAFDDPAPPGSSSFTAPTKPGSYPFHCSIHPQMHEILVVR
jgi:plastocyanin